MKRTTLLCLLIIAPLGCENHRHLRCTDADGNVVVDSTDVRRAPRQEGSSWAWENREGDASFEVGVPPYLCVYKRHAVEPEGTCDCPAPEEEVPLTIPTGPTKTSVPYAEQPESSGLVPGESLEAQ